MSLIVARKEGKQLAIVSDTKLTYPNHETKRVKTNPSEGIIKVIIINPNLCIAFAGEIEYAENALKEIQSDYNFDTTIQILNKYHGLSNKKIEFLVCSGSPVPKIHKIKANESKEVETAWIGDLDAFNLFQESIMGTRKKRIAEINKTKTNSKANVVINEMNLCIETNMQVNLFSKMSSAMDEVIEDDNISSVGGFKVNIVFEEKFDYTKYVKFYRGNVELFGTGSHIIGHGSASEGAYSVNFLGTSDDYKSVALHVRQGNFGIIYNKNNTGLLYPQITKLDEVDFVDYVKEKFNLFAPIETQDRIQKYLNEAKIAFDSGDFNKANDTLDKALNKVEEKKKAEILFYKGVCFLNLRNMPSTMQMFQEAINIDNSYKQKVMQILNQRR